MKSQNSPIILEGSSLLLSEDRTAVWAIFPSWDGGTNKRCADEPINRRAVLLAEARADAGAVGCAQAEDNEGWDADNKKCCCIYFFRYFYTSMVLSMESFESLNYKKSIN